MSSVSRESSGDALKVSSDCLVAMGDILPSMPQAGDGVVRAMLYSGIRSAIPIVFCSKLFWKDSS